MASIKQSPLPVPFSLSLSLSLSLTHFLSLYLSIYLLLVQGYRKGVRCCLNGRTCETARYLFSWLCWTKTLSCSEKYFSILKSGETQQTCFLIFVFFCTFYMYILCFEKIQNRDLHILKIFTHFTERVKGL